MPESSAPLQVAVVSTLAIRLMLGLARLGEADLAGWWSSQGMNPAVRFTLAGFRRTSKVVGAELAVLSATRRHRQVLPRETAVYLFSPYLPFVGWTRAYLAEQKTSDKRTIIDELLGWTTSDSARSELRALLEDFEHPAHDGASVSAAELQDPAVTNGLFIRFAESYITQFSEFSVPYVDLVA